MNEMENKETVTELEPDVDKIIQEAIKELQIKPKDILEKITPKDEKPPSVNGNKSNISLGDIGTYPQVCDKEINMLFDGLETVIIKLHNCLFRISYTNLAKRKFSCELINEKPEETP